MILLCLFFSVSLVNGCSFLWHEYRGSCYRLYGQKKTFQEARRTCQAESADLTVICDAGENDFIRQLFYIQTDISGYKFDGAWIGLTDVLVESSFVWIDGSPLIYSNWATGEPNNVRGADHVWIYGPSQQTYGFWDDIPESWELYFICERKHHTLKETSGVGSITAGSYLDKVVIEKIEARGKAECFQKCLQRCGCASANFWQRDRTRSGICLLNGGTAKDQHAIIGREGDLYLGQDVSNWVYLEVLKR